MSETPSGPPPRNARDPLPRVFIVCAVITALLLMVILGAIFLDMAGRSQQSPIRPMVPTEAAPVSPGNQLEDAP